MQPVKKTKRRHKKAHKKGKQPSRTEQHKSRSPGSKRKEKHRKPGVVKTPKEGGPPPVVKKKAPRRTRRNGWRWKTKKNGKKKGYQKMDWFWGMISQAEAEEFLKDGVHGEFMLRSTLFQEVTTFVLTVVSNDEKGKKFNHLEMKIYGSKWKLVHLEVGHKSILDLVNYYHHHSVISMKQILKLEVASKQPDWFIKSYKIMCPKNPVTLGSGNFSAVVTGAFRRRVVAVKILLSKGDRFLIDRELLMKEALIMNKLQHPYITKIVGISVDQLPPMLLVEMMETNLISHIQKYGKYTTTGEKLLYCWQLASALAFMAKQGIVHRDIAARNALFSRYGILKLSDFGLSDYEVKLTAVNTNNDKLPLSWMAPESMTVNNIAATFNEKTDVWMFGVCCNEIFNNGFPPLAHLDTKTTIKKLVEYKDGDVLFEFSQYVPEDIKKYFQTRIWNAKPALRPPFEEIATVMDLWIKVRYSPPPLEKRTVQMIPNCWPLTNSEYEILYENNWDWLPAVRKVKIKKERKKVKSKKNEKEMQKKPKEVMKYLKRKLIKRRKRHRLRIKLRWWRVRRREEKKRVKALINFTKSKQKATNQRSNGYKRVIEKFEKLVDLYWKLMMVKWRKRAPNRNTRFRLRRHRVINEVSKHLASRNGKVHRVTIKKRELLKQRNRAEVVRPSLPQIRFVAQKKKTKVSLRSIKKEKKLPNMGTLTGMDPMMLEQLRETNKRMIRKRKRHNLRKRNKRKHRKKRRMKRRQRRRQKHRRRYRKMRMQVKRAAMTIDQKERLRSLNKRRDEKQKLANRLKRNEKIGKILRDWSQLRKFFIFRRTRKVMRRMLLEERQEMKMKKTKEPKSKEKIVRSGRRKSKK